MTIVINIKDAPAGWKNNDKYVYIGRGSVYGNPFKIGAVCPLCNQLHSAHGSTLDCFEDYMKSKLTYEPEFHQELMKLKDKILVCFCKPRRCHGDILAHYVNHS